jgi:hypothetical protein
MKLNSYNTSLLLVAILLATARPVVAGGGWLALPNAARTADSGPTEEREGGESERESGAEKSSEGRKTRRIVAMVHWHSSAARLESGAAERVGLPGSSRLPFATASEHLLRWGLGTPLRI